MKRGDLAACKTYNCVVGLLVMGVIVVNLLAVELGSPGKECDLEDLVKLNASFI